MQRVDGTFTVPVLPEPARLPAGLALPPEPAGPAGAQPGQRPGGALHLPGARGRHERPAADLRPRPARRRRGGAAAGAARRRPGNFVACATDWSGMSAEDLPNVFALSEDLSRFPTLADRNQQGFLNFLFLGRLMVHPQGLAVAARVRRQDRHAAPLLRGREPGRHPRRGAHRGGARLRALGADRPGDELQPAAHARDASSRRSRRSSTRATGAGWSAPCSPR